MKIYKFPKVHVTQNFKSDSIVKDLTFRKNFLSPISCVILMQMLKFINLEKCYNLRFITIWDLLQFEICYNFRIVTILELLHFSKFEILFRRTNGQRLLYVLMIAKKLKFKLNIKGLLGSEQWGDILANGSTTGAIERIVSNLADIGIGNYVLRQSRLNIMDSSVAYFSLPVVFAIPLGEKFTPFEKLLKPFKNMVWIMILIAFSIGAFVILIINWKFKKVRNFVYGTGIKNPTVNMLIAIFGGAQTKVPGRNFARFILMLFLLFCLVLRNVYQGTLFIFQQSDGRQKEVQSLKEMVEKNFTYFMYDSYSELTQNLPDVFKKWVASFEFSKVQKPSKVKYLPLQMIF